MSDTATVPGARNIQSLLSVCKTLIHEFPDLMNVFNAFDPSRIRRAGELLHAATRAVAIAEGDLLGQGDLLKTEGVR